MSFLLPFSPKYREFKPREKEEIKKDSNGSLKHNLIGGYFTYESRKQKLRRIK